MKGDRQYQADDFKKPVSRGPRSYGDPPLSGDRMNDNGNLIGLEAMFV